jgi:hypothetical protein
MTSAVKRTVAHNQLGTTTRQGWLALLQAIAVAELSRLAVACMLAVAV